VRQLESGNAALRMIDKKDHLKRNNTDHEVYIKGDWTQLMVKF
jgi:hypothetical protein